MSDAQGVALRLLSRREYSQHELLQRLRQRGFSDTDCDAALKALVAAGWQSDERFAEAYARSRIQRLQGPLKIVAGLRERGVERGLAEQVLDNLQPDWLSLAQRFLARYSAASVDAAKVSRALQRRGFTGAQTVTAVRVWRAN